MKLRALKHRQRERIRRYAARRWVSCFEGVCWNETLMGQENARARAAGLPEPFVPYVPWRLIPAKRPVR